jgi:hypothetical protein
MAAGFCLPDINSLVDIYCRGGFLFNSCRVNGKHTGLKSSIGKSGEEFEK